MLSNTVFVKTIGFSATSEPVDVVFKVFVPEVVVVTVTVEVAVDIVKLFGSIMSLI